MLWVTSLLGWCAFEVRAVTSNCLEHLLTTCTVHCGGADHRRLWQCPIHLAALDRSRHLQPARHPLVYAAVVSVGLVIV